MALPQVTVNVTTPNGYGYSLLDLCQENEIETRLDYSGKGMRDATCFAIFGDQQDLIRFVLRVLVAYWGDVDEDWENVHTDSMGTRLVFYWPDIRAVVEPDE